MARHRPRVLDGWLVEHLARLDADCRRLAPLVAALPEDVAERASSAALDAILEHVGLTAHQEAAGASGLGWRVDLLLQMAADPAAIGFFYPPDGVRRFVVEALDDALA